MAEFLWTFAAQELLKKTVKLAAKQIGLAWGFKNELSNLRDSLLMVEAILRDVDRIKAEHQAVKLWVEKLEDIVFEADVLLDELAYEDIRRKAEPQKEVTVSNFVSFSKNPLVFRLKMANKIKNIARMLEKHYSAASTVGLVAIISKQIEPDFSQIQETDSFPDEFGVIGREAEVLEIVKISVDLSYREAVSVLPIVGMGGLGKTALAKVIFNHELIKGNFDRTIWVCVSEPFLIKKILRTILETLNPNFGGLDSKEALLQELQKLLNDKKYFLVLDDVWNENPILWNELKSCLLKISQRSGNVVVVTTRSGRVAEIMETHSRYHLTKLSDDHCWSLFKKYAFGNEFLGIPELDIVQKELVKRFGGIPLVVKVLGGIVKFDETHEGLQQTLENLMKIQLQDENHVVSTIKLTVDRLPLSSLKQCFAYCSNFPKDFKFRKEALIQMWIAQGFIQPPEGSDEMMEDIGEKYFNVLLSRLLFQDIVKDNRGRIVFCKMHDLIHDVALAISNSQELILDPLDLLDGEPWRREACSASHKIRTPDCNENHSRKLHMLTFDSHVFHNKITDFIYLRVLIAHSWFICKLPNSIAKLKHLRYLDISYSTIRELPESLFLLYNLQTLKLSRFLNDLPKNLRKLVSLRHLEFFADPCDTKQMPQHLGKLIQLQTLSSFVVGFDDGCKIEELGPLRNLKGKLNLLCLERVKSKKEAMAANLVEKGNISFLYFHWTLRCERSEGSNYNDLNVLEGLQPHKNLQALRIHNFLGKLLPNGIFVENLVEIYLHDCEICEALPMLGQLSKLEVLELRCLHSVGSIGEEFYGNYREKRTLFPKLKAFHINEMISLENWEEIMVVSNGTIFPHLESLSIVCCPRLTNIPNFFASHHESSFPSFQGSTKLRSLKILGCENLRKLPNDLEFCSSLENMRISNSSKLNSPPRLQNMQNLTSLSMTEFRKLPDGLAQLRKLKKLSVHGYLQGYDWSPLVHLGSLENLMLVDLEGSGAVQLPQQLAQLTSLRSLHISHFNGVEDLPECFGNFTSLEVLKLYNCVKLKNMPSKEAMSKLTRLKSLRVYGCSQLELNEGDFEWVNISHVPTIN
ncbi:putative disease resistance protein RGA3 [Benincasa hispida]|uniref:putative disease resistance protein RGA3 n=1 Tax=Benincasa hispida TaxID=102211 RepID=UPI0019027B05|nr:putative disease resistance protein RGA3 [Benincasa hispida]